MALTGAALSLLLPCTHRPTHLHTPILPQHPLHYCLVPPASWPSPHHRLLIPPKHMHTLAFACELPAAQQPGQLLLGPEGQRVLGNMPNNHHHFISHHCQPSMDECRSVMNHHCSNHAFLECQEGSLDRLALTSCQVLHHITSYHIASHHINHVTSHHITSHRIAQQCTQQYTTPS